MMDTFHCGAIPLPTVPLSARRSSHGSSSSSEGFCPRMDICDSERAHELMETVTIELPGVPREEVFVCLEGQKIVIAGDIPAWEDGEYLLRERQTGAFRRAVPVPRGLHAEDVRAKMQNGLLVLTFPKTLAAHPPSEDKSGIRIREIPVSK
ncbi:HSP20-like chaperone [Auricularia subglabra TFB-10046 SS5]|nr:HSP20-like chaperone [Auricularia subglabra TFB-10046 SS5]